MSIYDWQRLKTQPTETERNRQEQNKRLYDIAAGRIAEETERDSEEFSKFFSDLVVYSRFYEKRDTTAYAQYMAEEEAKKRSQQQNEQSIMFIDKMIENSSGLTPRGRELRKELGLAAPIVGIDYDTGNIGYRDIDPSHAQDLLAYGRENMLALSGTEQASIYKTTRLYTAGNNIFGTLEDQFPEMFPKPTPEEQSNIDRALTFQGSWDRLLDVIPFVDGRTEGSQNIDTNIIFLENVRAWWDEGILPTDFLGGTKQEGWDGKQAWKVLSEYHPDFAAYLTNVAGLNPEMLGNTPNHWEFRYMINESIDVSNLAAILENERRDSSTLGYTLDWGWNFLRQSFRSADMPFEIALTAASFGAYGAIAAATNGIRGVKALKVANTINDQVQTLNNINKLSQATRNTNRVIHGARTAQALMVPSNWGSIAASSITNRVMTGGWGLVTEGVRWGSELNLAQRFLYMVPVDATQGLIEGFLYGLQNQLTDNMAFSGERLWQEIYSEALGQIAFGPLFRTTNLSVGKLVESTNAKALGPGIWNIVSKPINPNLKRMIEFQAQLTNKDLSLDQIEQAYFGAYLTLHQHIVWQNMTDNTNAVMPPHVMQAMVVLQSAARQKGINIDLAAVSQGVLDSLPVDLTTGKNIVLEEEEAAMLLYGATLDQMSERGLTITQTDWDIVNRQIAIQFLVADKMEEMGISRMQQAQMMSEDPAKYKEEVKKAYAAVLLETDTITQKVERLAEIGKSAVEKAGIPIRINVVNTTQQAVSIIEAFRTGDGKFDTTLIREIFENGQAVPLNISQEVFNKILGFAKAQEESAVAESTPEAPKPATEATSETQTAPSLDTSTLLTTIDGIVDIPSDTQGVSGEKQKARKAIQDSVKRIKEALARNNIKEIATERWRLAERLRKFGAVDPELSEQIEQLKLLQAQLDEALAQQGIEVEDPTGQPYTVGLINVNVKVWVPGFVEGKDTHITKAFTPIIRQNGEIIQTADVEAIDGDPKVQREKQKEETRRKKELERKLSATSETPSDVEVDSEVNPVESPTSNASSESESLDPPITENLSEESVQQPTKLKETLTSAGHTDRERFVRELQDDTEFRDCT